MTKLYVGCRNCGSLNVGRDAWAEWDVERQEWVLRGGPFDNAYCFAEDCEEGLEETEVAEDGAISGKLMILQSPLTHPTCPLCDTVLVFDYEKDKIGHDDDGPVYVAECPNDDHEHGSFLLQLVEDGGETEE